MRLYHGEQASRVTISRKVWWAQRYGLQCTRQQTATGRAVLAVHFDAFPPMQRGIHSQTRLQLTRFAILVLGVHIRAGFYKNPDHKTVPVERSHVKCRLSTAMEKWGSTV